MEIKLYTLLILLGTYSHIKIECCYKISANGKGLCVVALSRNLVLTTTHSWAITQIFLYLSCATST